MPARQVCQNFFHDALAPFHKYRQNALLDATIALINGASLTLTSIGRYLPGPAQVKNKIKRVDRLLGNESLHRDIPLIFRNIIAMLTSQLSIVTDAGFQSAWCWHIRSLGWDFICRVRGNIQMQLDSKGECWFRRQELQARSKPEYLGTGTLARSEYARCDGHFYLHKKEPKGWKNRRSRYRIERKSQIKDGRSSAKEPWLIFSSTNDFKPREIMKLYSRRMQIEQNFRDEKSERFGFALRASYSRSVGRMLVLSLLATLSTIVLWLIAIMLKKKDYI